MILEEIRPATFQITLHAYELAALVAAARLTLETPDSALTRDARVQLQTVLDSYEDALRRKERPGGHN